MKKGKKFVSTISNEKRKNIVGYLFLSPWILGSLLFAIIPTVLTIIMSLAEIRWAKGPEFYFFEKYVSGEARGLLQNYISIFTNGEDLIHFVNFMKVELLYVPVIVVMAFILAVILTKNIRFKSVFRTIFFMPVIIMSGALVSALLGIGEAATTMDGGAVVEEVNIVISSFVFRIIASYSYDIAIFINDLFSNFVMILWLSGIPIILFINAINKINKDLYEAARIDGANSWQMIWKITIPNCRYVAFIAATFSIVQISVMPLSPIYIKISDGLRSATNGQLGVTAAFAILNLLFIIMLIGIFAFILMPRQKKAKEVLTYTQVEQLRATKRRNRHLMSKKERKQGGI